MSLHENNGSCPYCQKIFARYPGFYEPLRTWFVLFQASHPEAHISCAGRGRQDQEECFQRGASKARYGESAHNRNCAIDIFVISPGQKMYDEKWFKYTLWPALTPWQTWLGAPSSRFYELPHVEVENWRDLNLPLVEE